MTATALAVAATSRRSGAAGDAVHGSAAAAVTHADSAASIPITLPGPSAEDAPSFGAGRASEASSPPASNAIVPLPPTSRLRREHDAQETRTRSTETDPARKRPRILPSQYCAARRTISGHRFRGREGIPQRPHQRRRQLLPLGAHADAKFAQRRAAVVGVEDAQLAAQRALVEHQARHDADPAAEADQG